MTLNVLPTDNDVRFFDDNGYWLSAPVLDAARLDALRRAMDDVHAGTYETGREPWMGGWKPGGDPTQIRKTDNSHWSNNTLRALATDPVIGEMAARLMRTREVRLWHDQLLYKPGQGPRAASLGGNVGWHQDHQYWQCAPPTLITAWVAFDDVTPDNGCMMVIPGSHRWGLMQSGNFFEGDLDALSERIRGESGKELEPTPCTLKAGAVSFHHCLTLHGSGPNRTNAPRRSLVLHVMPEDANYVAGTPGDAHMNVTLLTQAGGKPGERFAGDQWPVLYREAL